MSMIDYFDAIERIETNKTIRIPPGSKVTYDNVSLEAGRQKGSLKKSRPEYDAVRAEVRAAASRQRKKNVLQLSKEKVLMLQKQIDMLEARLFESYNREVLLIARLHEMENPSLGSEYENVLLFRKPSPKEGD